MKKNTILTLLTLTIVAVSANAAEPFNDMSDFTGDSLFAAPVRTQPAAEQDSGISSGRQKTTPPIKQLRMSIQKRSEENAAKKLQLAPTDPNASIYKTETNTSDYASKEVEEHFEDDNIMPDGFEADDEAVVENRKAKHFWNKEKSSVQNDENTENIVLDCDNMDYDTDKYCLYATGNVNVQFVKQQTTVLADKITYDRMNNTIKAEGNVKIIKHGQTVQGDYIFVDMNEENALIENPITKTSTIEMRAKKGYVYGDKIIQEQGSIEVKDSFPVVFKTSEGGASVSNMLMPKNNSISEDMEKGLVKIYAREIQITQKDDHEILALKRPNVKKGKWTVLKFPAVKFYTNKNQDYIESNVWELGSYRDLGMFIGPGFVFELPKGSVLKAIPMLNYNHGIGVGAIGRFSSGTNQTQVGYGTTISRFLVRGKQKLDDNLYLQYTMNDYNDEWWMGRRRPKYGLGLVYRKGYGQSGFLLKDRFSSYEHQFDFGYYHDIDKDKHFSELRGSNIGTTRLRYMAQAVQELYRYSNPDTQMALNFNITGQLSAALYGTGDTQFIGRIGPMMHTQVKRWMQDIGFLQSVYDDHSPLAAYDAYRYGRSSIYIREYFRICKYLTVAWFGSIDLSNYAPTDNLFQENAFYISVGPEDVKFNIGYDFTRANTFFTMELMMDAKGARVDYDKLVIKQDNKLEDDKKKKKDSYTEPKDNSFKNSEKAPVLQRAVVEDIKTVDDVL